MGEPSRGLSVSPTRALIVTAVSDKHKDQDPKIQELHLRDQCARRGWDVAEVLELRMSRYSASQAAQASAMVLDAVRRTRADVLCVVALDRVLRTGILPTLQFLQLLEAHLGCNLYSLHEPEVSTATASPDMRQFMISFRAWMANLESKRRGDRVRDKVHARRAQAASIGQRARWGRGHLVTPADRDRLAQLERDHPGLSLREVGRRLGLPWSTVRRLKRSLGQSSPPNWGPAPSESERPVPKVPLEQPGGASDA
ncbi:MAG TPA: recombinase family protein [Candidatus Thermoplasmatota archaeon]|nr:recombinase family protein [Candidatus Thermoplasmatota archaeon]